jgi:hypothetical protein
MKDAMKVKDGLKLRGLWRIEKYDENGNLIETSEFENLFLNSGINEIWKLVTGNGGTAFTNATAQIGVGDSTTAESATQTDLQATTNKTYKGMDSGYPTSGTGQQAVFKATFGGSDANYSWNEFVIKNATSGVCLNRKVSNQGTKASGQTWVITVTLSLA